MGQQFCSRFCNWSSPDPVDHGFDTPKPLQSKKTSLTTKNNTSFDTIITITSTKEKLNQKQAKAKGGIKIAANPSIQAGGQYKLKSNYQQTEEMVIYNSGRFGKIDRKGFLTVDIKFPNETFRRFIKNIELCDEQYQLFVCPNKQNPFEPHIHIKPFLEVQDHQCILIKQDVVLWLKQKQTEAAKKSIIKQSKSVFKQKEQIQDQLKINVNKSLESSNNNSDEVSDQNYKKAQYSDSDQQLQTDSNGPKIKCPNNHQLSIRKAGEQGANYRCNVCGQDIGLTNEWLNCSICDFDLCGVCLFKLIIEASQSSD